MKNIFKRIISLSLSLCMIFVLCACSACKMVPYTIRFNINNIPDSYTEDLFVSSDFEFTRLNGVVVRPSIKYAVGYTIYLTIYSKTGKENVTVQKISVEDEGVVCAYFELNKEVTFVTNDEQLYMWHFEGWREENSVFIREENLEEENHNVFDLIVTLEVKSDDTTVNRSIRYEVEMLISYVPAWYR